MTIDLVKHRYLFLGLGVFLAVVSLISIFSFGFKQGIDFTGGTLWRFRVGATPDLMKIEEALKKETGVSEAHLTYSETDGSVLVRLPVLDQAVHDQALPVLRSQIPGFTELSYESIGPSVGAELRKNAIFAVAYVLIAISLYIAFAFRRVSRPISSWKYGVATLVSLLHDVLIPAGLLAYLGYAHGVEIDSNFVVALLVIAGFSVHDTIVVFDRIRENLIIQRGKSEFKEILNASVNQTMARSINTSLTLVFVLVALLILGPQTLQYFIATLLVGTLVGTYSSIFIASPFLYLWHTFRPAK